MNSTPVSQKCCCTCQHFGKNSQRQGSSVKWEVPHTFAKLNQEEMETKVA